MAVRLGAWNQLVYGAAIGALGLPCFGNVQKDPGVGVPGRRGVGGAV